jgi:hypothetical protein
MKKERLFLFERKTQKTFAWLSRASPAAYTKSQKFFVLFFKKEHLLPNLKSPAYV